LEKEKTKQRTPVKTRPSEKSPRHETWSGVEVVCLGGLGMRWNGMGWMDGWMDAKGKHAPVMTEPANLEAPYMAVKEDETKPRSVLLSLSPPSLGPCCSPGAATANALRARL
jgi:hypothetical protein